MDILPFYGERAWLTLECKICPRLSFAGHPLWEMGDMATFIPANQKFQFNDFVIDSEMLFIAISDSLFNIPVLR
ncbi:MAG: hypothetical protein CL537_10915 [Alcanivoracaceae bacterium]|nr:hypothetical protein [Alcanivoracaceae bacterium]